MDREASEFNRHGLPVRLVLDREKPIIFSKEYLQSLRESTRPSAGGEDTFPVQMECDFNAAVERRFRLEDFRYYPHTPEEERKTGPGNIYIMVDPANEKNKGACYTFMWVVKAAADGNYYILDAVRDRLGLTERAKMLFFLHQKWAPVMGVGYEKYGMQADIEHIEYEQARMSYRFNITKLAGFTAKDSRIEGLAPIFQNGRIFFPRQIPYRDPSSGSFHNLVDVFRDEEFLPWPNSKYKDGLDCLARITDPDLNVRFPKSNHLDNSFTPYFQGGDREETSWFAA